MNYLKLEFVIALHDDIIKNFGGRAGFHEPSLLESAVANPMMAVFGQEMYPSVFDKAAAYLFFISKNHAFSDGNKRTGTACAIIFLRLNGFIFNIPDGFDDFVVEVAESKHQIPEISKYLESLSTPHIHNT